MDVDEMAAALGIALEAEWREGVRLNLAASLRLGAEVAAFALPDELELAPVFTP